MRLKCVDNAAKKKSCEQHSRHENHREMNSRIKSRKNRKGQNHQQQQQHHLVNVYPKPSQPEAIKCRGNFEDKSWPDGINYCFLKNLKCLFSPFSFYDSSVSFRCTSKTQLPKTMFDHKNSSSDNIRCLPPKTFLFFALRQTLSLPFVLLLFNQFPVTVFVSFVSLNNSRLSCVYLGQVSFFLFRFLSSSPLSTSRRDCSPEREAGTSRCEGKWWRESILRLSQHSPLCLAHKSAFLP